MKNFLSDKNIADVSVIVLVNELLREAIERRVSDIHIDPTVTSLRIRFRVDGLLHDAVILPKELSPPIISRLKVLSKLRTDEHQRPQDGRFHFQGNALLIDIRISVMPTYHGENAVLRLLIGHEEERSLRDLGFEDSTASVIETAIKKSSGMILVCGPTGSGKTTTLYRLLSMMNTEERSIVTIEDPIEYALEGLEQIQVNNQTGLSFANGLRSILRQDPDIIMVGEIRDKETASIAINSALTGHLLFSTLHTRDAVGALVRLNDLGIDHYLVASTLSLIIAQRLVRRLCSNCKDKSAGVCSICEGTGYHGRLSINEVISIDDEMREMISTKTATNILRKRIKEKGALSIEEDGFHKVTAGLTSKEELLRVIYD